VLVLKRHSVKPQKCKHLEAITVVIGNAEQLGIGIESDHWILYFKVIYGAGV